MCMSKDRLRKWIFRFSTSVYALAWENACSEWECLFSFLASPLEVIHTCPHPQSSLPHGPEMQKFPGAKGKTPLVKAS